MVTSSAGPDGQGTAGPDDDADRLAAVRGHGPGIVHAARRRATRGLNPAGRAAHDEARVPAPARGSASPA